MDSQNIEMQYFAPWSPQQEQDMNAQMQGEEIYILEEGRQDQAGYVDAGYQAGYPFGGYQAGYPFEGYQPAYVFENYQAGFALGDNVARYVPVVNLAANNAHGLMEDGDDVIEFQLRELARHILETQALQFDIEDWNDDGNDYYLQNCPTPYILLHRNVHRGTIEAVFVGENDFDPDYLEFHDSELNAFLASLDN